MKNTTRLFVLFGALAVLFAVGFVCLPTDTVSAQYYNCQSHAYQSCTNNALFWYDSCGNQQELYQICPNGCYGNSCQHYNNNNSYYPNYYNCNYHAYKLCVGNNIVWYDSCGNQQDLYQSCSFNANFICKYGQCVYQAPQPLPNPYTAHYSIKCYNNNLYWYDSLGALNTTYKNCEDANSCTVDSCSGKNCSNTLKCDGSTCASGTADYSKYCQNNNNNNNAGGNVSGLSISFSAKPDASPSIQWQKSIQLNSNSQAYFMIFVANNSGSEIANLNVSASIPGQITTLGNLQVNGVQISSDITSGISIGSLAAGATKTVTFEGKTQSFSTQATAQANAIVNVNGAIQSDSISINFNPSQAAVAPASVSSSEVSSGLWTFLKRWYLWILVGLVLIFLFVVVFRRLSNAS